MEADAAEEAESVEIAEKNTKRLSWGIPAFMRKKFKERSLAGEENPYCEFKDLVFFPGFKDKIKPTYDF